MRSLTALEEAEYSLLGLDYVNDEAAPEPPCELCLKPATCDTYDPAEVRERHWCQDHCPTCQEQV